MGTNLIISSEVTSLFDSFLGCGVDKLILQLNYPLRLDEIREKLLSLNYKLLFKNNKDFKSNVLLEKSGRQIYCFGTSLPNTDYIIYKIALKPNLFDGHEEVLRCLREIFGIRINEADIRRIDINFDFRLAFIELLKLMDIRGKQKTIEYLSYSGKLTSIRHGDSDPIKVYDRARKLRIDEKLSRIEFVFNFKRSQFKLNNYDHAILDALSRPGMSNVHFLEPEFPFKLGIELFDKEFKKFIQFFCLYEQYGFSQAKKIFNDNNNFHRNFRKTIQCEKSNLNLVSIFRQNSLQRGACGK